MIDAIDNGILLTNLNAGVFDILNVGELTGPPDLLYSDNAVLSDARNIIDGTVDDASVAENAGIVQSKLLLDGVIPTAWLGKTSTTAAEGDLVERVANKDQPNGYVSLTGGGKLPTGSVPLSGTGTVTELAFTFPDDLALMSDTSTNVWTFESLWAAQNPETWFGNISVGSASPTFIQSPAPLGLIPNLAAAKFTTETFSPARLPLAVGVGVSHATGAIPVTDGDEGISTDYLARDMTFKRMEDPISYQPTLPDPAITILYFAGPVAMVNVTIPVKGTNLFYLTVPEISPAFIQITTLPVPIGIGIKIMVYASKIGYNNSEIVKLTIPDPAAPAPYA